MARIIAEDDDFIPKTVLDRLDQMAGDLTGSLLKDLAGRFKNEIADGIKGGLTSVQIGKNLQAKYGDFKNKTTQSIVARTLLHAAYTQGAIYDSLMDEDIVAFRFSNPADSRSTKICAHLAGKVIEKKDIHEYIPPLHWGCRSVLVPLYYNDDIDPTTIITPKVRDSAEFRKNVTNKLDKNFTEFTTMNLKKAVEETEEARMPKATEEIQKQTAATLDHLQTILAGETLPRNDSESADFVVREAMLETLRRTMPEEKNIKRTKDYLKTDAALNKIYEAYKNKDLKGELLKHNAYDIARAVEKAGARIFDNEAVKAFKAESVEDKSLDLYLNELGGDRKISDQLKSQIKNLLRQYGRDPDFFNLVLNDLRRQATAPLSSYSDYQMLDEDLQNIFNEYLSEFFKSVDRGAKVSFKDRAALDKAIINTFIRHPDYDRFVDSVPFATLNDVAYTAMLKRLNEAIAGVTKNEFEANEVRNRILFAGVERIDTRSAAKAVESIKNKLNNLQNSHSGGIINSETNYENLLKIADEKYEKIRERSDDIEKISQNTGFDVDIIKKIKDHIFFDEHELSNGKRLFDSDIDMAIAWERMSEGKEIKQSDLILLNHEIYERELMNDKGLSYRAAHDLANEKYNWEAALFNEESDDK